MASQGGHYGSDWPEVIFVSACVCVCVEATTVFLSLTFIFCPNALFTMVKRTRGSQRESLWSYDRWTPALANVEEVNWTQSYSLRV